MGYNLYIGEAEIDVNMESRCARVRVSCHEVEGAPLNSTGDHSNRIYPSYSQWAEFCRRVGLYEVFYAGQQGGDWWTDDEGKEHEGLIYCHPGATELTEAHYRAFVRASESYQPRAQDVVIEENGEAVDFNRRRLDWLVWWTRWVLDNCQYPTFYNS